MNECSSQFWSQGKHQINLFTIVLIVSLFQILFHLAAYKILGIFGTKMADGIVSRMSWVELDALDAVEDSQDNLLVGDAGSSTNRVVNVIVDDVTVAGELAVTVAEVIEF